MAAQEPEQPMDAESAEAIRVAERKAQGEALQEVRQQARQRARQRLGERIQQVAADMDSALQGSGAAVTGSQAMVAAADELAEMCETALATGFDAAIGSDAATASADESEAVDRQLELLRIATEVAFTGGTVAPEEFQVLEALADRLGVTDSDFKSMVFVVVSASDASET